MVASLGAAGGAVNAWLCVSRIPEPVHDSPTFEWVTVPAGAVHGAILGLVPVLGVFMTSEWRLIYRFLLALPVGWLAGYLSWIPLDRWALDEPWRRSLLWPFEGKPGFDVAWTPFAYFGVVSALLFLSLCVCGSRRSGVIQAACGSGAGVLGSLWFWSEFQPWYFAAIHGTVWGLLVGWGVFLANQSSHAREIGVA
jgi:hypothetical protein